MSYNFSYPSTLLTPTESTIITAYCETCKNKKKKEEMTDSERRIYKFHKLYADLSPKLSKVQAKVNSKRLFDILLGDGIIVELPKES